MKRYLWNLLVALDQLGNTIFGGYPVETISSRAGKAYARGDTWAVLLCRALHVLDRGHCAKSIEPDGGEE
jgi:hypothetical protein